MPTGTALKALVIHADGSASSPFHAMSVVLPTRGPKGWVPGPWHRQPGPIRYAKSGLHVCHADNLPWWTGHARGRALTAYAVEYRGQISPGAHGLSVREYRVLRPATHTDLHPKGT